MSTVRSGPSSPAAHGHGDRRPGLAADPLDDLVDRVAQRLAPVDGHDDVAGLEAGRLGRAAFERGDDAGLPALGLLDPDADADVRAGQRVVAGLALLGRHEIGVTGVADGVGHAVDGAPDELLVVQLVAPDVLAVERVPGLADDLEVRGRWGGRRVRGGGRRAHGRGHDEATDPDPGAERRHQREHDDHAKERPIDVRARSPVTSEPGRDRSRRRSRPAARGRWSIRSGSGRCPWAASSSCGGDGHRARSARVAPD